MRDNVVAIRAGKGKNEWYPSKGAPSRFTVSEYWLKQIEYAATLASAMAAYLVANCDKEDSEDIAQFACAMEALKLRAKTPDVMTETDPIPVHFAEFYKKTLRKIMVVSPFCDSALILSRLEEGLISSEEAFLSLLNIKSFEYKNPRFAREETLKAAEKIGNLLAKDIFSKGDRSRCIVNRFGVTQVNDWLVADRDVKRLDRSAARGNLKLLTLTKGVNVMDGMI